MQQIPQNGHYIFTKKRVTTQSVVLVKPNFKFSSKVHIMIRDQTKITREKIIVTYDEGRFLLF